MVEFVTLFLGLIVGPQTVGLSVDGGVATVEVLLDSRPVGTLHGEPWQLVCDLGPRLLPHELVAVARDGDGQEVARARQWINLPTPRATARLVLEREGGDHPTRARVIWQAFDHERPERVTVTLDGRLLSVADLDAIRLPPTDPTRIHILTAELEFSDTTRARAEAVFGGVYGDQVTSELTAVVLESDRRRLPSAEALAGRLTRAGRPLSVVATERGPLDLLVVREEAVGTFVGLQRLATVAGGQRIPSRLGLPKLLGPRDRVHFVFPTPEPSSRTRHFEKMPVSENILRPEADTLFRILTAVAFGGHESALPRQRLADAVAVAGLQAAAGNRRRAVLLITSGESADASRLSPAVVRDYLDSLAVPLFVWSLAENGRPGSVEAWGEVIEISEWSGLVRAFRSLQRSLDSQLVVWVEGRHLPQQIALGPEARELRLARRQTPELGARIADLSQLAPGAREPATTAQPDPATAPGDRRFAAGFTRHIAQARAHLGESPITGRLGSLDLLTDHLAPRLLKRLDQLARETPRLYDEHHGLPAALDAGGTVILFADEDDYRSLERDLGRGGLELAGHTAPGVVTLYAGKRDARALEATFIHELVHLLNRHALGPELPVWLDEGLAERMALAQVDARGELEFLPLDARSLTRGNRLELYGPLTVLGELVDAVEAGDLPPLPELLELDREGFRSSSSRRLLYALFAFWVHYLASADTEVAAGFRDYLAAVADAAGTQGISLVAKLGRGWDELEPGFHRWLDSLAEGLRPPPIRRQGGG